MLGTGTVEVNKTVSLEPAGFLSHNELVTNTMRGISKSSHSKLPSALTLTDLITP